MPFKALIFLDFFDAVPNEPILQPILGTLHMTNAPSDQARHLRRKDRTFRQAEGIHPLPKMLAYGELDRRLRTQIWDLFYFYFDSDKNITSRRPIASFTRPLALEIAREVFELPLDEAEKLTYEYKEYYRQLKTTILGGAYSDCLEIVQVALRRSRESRDSDGRGLVGSLVNILNSPTSPYQVVNFPPMTIVPRGTEDERAAFERDWPEIESSPLDGSKTHLRQAAEALNKGDYTGAMRESIHAVESAVKTITGKPNADLAAGLKALEKERNLHSALKDGFIKLYGYASDEKGVRHALIAADNADVGKEDALFFFSSCTAFVAYLSRKFSGIG